MKRPFAVIGFSMLISFLIVTNITHKMAIALLIGAIAVFSGLIIFKALRRYLTVIFSLFGVIAFTVSFLSAERYFVQEKEKSNEKQIISGVVCEIPKESDYAFTYVVKVADESYKVRFVAEEDQGIREGDYVRINSVGYGETEFDMVPYFLSSKVFFTIFANEECSIEKTGKTNLFYKNIGEFKRGFTEIVTGYLPGKNGAMALAMTIGDKSRLDEKAIDCFNYSGTAHLLVISGLHLTLWSFGVMNFIDKNSKLRKYSSLIGVLCLLLYSAVTGFGISVLRAGAMIGAVLIGRIVGRNSDSINSIGLAITFILLINPFAPYSPTLWFTVLSTLGILAYSGKIQKYINEKTLGKPISRLPFFEFIKSSVSISFSTAVFTLPVFLFYFRFMPTASVLANLIMVEIAMVMMVVTVIGVICHICFLPFISRICFFVAGLIGEIMHITAEKIGMADWSTMSLNHRYYEYFVIILLFAVVITIVLRKYKIDIVKHMTVLFTAAFCLLAVYCTAYDYNTPSVEVLITDNKPVITVCSKGESVLIGLQDTKYVRTIKQNLNYHNVKQLDYIVVTENEEETASRLIHLHNVFGNATTYFPYDSPEIFKENSQSPVTDLELADNVNIDVSDDEKIKIEGFNKKLLIVNCKNTENVYENAKKYDIIILYNDNSNDAEQYLEKTLNNSCVVAANEGDKVSVYL